MKFRKFTLAAVSALFTASTTPSIAVAQSKADNVPVTFNESGGQRQVLKFNDYGAAQGMSPPSDYGGFAVNRDLIRGFPNESALRNGYRDFGYLGVESDAASEGVEIFKGPASALYGNGKPGGDINQLTFQPDGVKRRDVQLQIDRYGFHSMRADLGDTVEKSVGNNNAEIALRIGMGIDAGPGKREFDDYESYAISPMMAWKPSPDTRLQIETDFLRSRDQIQPTRLPEKPLIDFSDSKTLGEAGDWYRDSGNTMRVSVEHLFSAPLRLRQAFFVQNAHMATDATELDVYGLTGEGLFTENGRGVRRIGLRERQYIRSKVSQTEIYAVFDTLNMSHQLLFGLEFGDYRIDSTNALASLAALDLFAPQYGATPREFLLTNDQYYQNDTVVFYTQDRIHLSSRWQALLGMQAQNIRARSENRRENTGYEGDDHLLSPRVGLVYTFADNWSWFASTTRSARPQLDAVTANGDLLPPEESQQFETGVQSTVFDGLLLGTVTVYQLTRTNLATTDVNDPNFSVAGGKRRSKGIEIQLRGEISPSTTLDVGIEAMRATVLKDNDIERGTRLPGVASLFANTWVTQEFVPGWSLGIGFIAEGRRRAAWPPNELRLPGYVLVDSSLAYRGEDWRIQWSFGNLLGRRALISDGYAVRIAEMRSVNMAISAGFK
jgi:iron complex outermembrane receptor protein